MRSIFTKKTKELFTCPENDIRPVQCNNTASFISFLIGVAYGKPPHFFYMDSEKRPMKAEAVMQRMKANQLPKRAAA